LPVNPQGSCLIFAGTPGQGGVGPAGARRITGGSKRVGIAVSKDWVSNRVERGVPAQKSQGEPCEVAGAGCKAGPGDFRTAGVQRHKRIRLGADRLPDQLRDQVGERTIRRAADGQPTTSATGVR
jgi:hypothetical protein